jgi:acetylornithine deacetylase/succinyl-diaminopimelate desuccinylase-like protein
MKSKLAVLFLLLLIPIAAAPLDPAVQSLSHSILKELIEINTTDTPRGNVTTAALAMQKRFAAAGLPASDMLLAGPNDRKQNLIVRLRGASTSLAPILIIGHIDVVEARREDWTTDPFVLVEKGGYFYGRGTQDMKGSDAMVITTLLRFLHEGYKPDRDIILALTADEEGGTANGVDWLLKNKPEQVRAGFVLNPDAGGANTVNGKPLNLDIEAAEKVYADFLLTVRNPGGHSSLPVPDNAIYHLVDSLARLEKYQFPFELSPVTRGFFESIQKVATPEEASTINAVLVPHPDPAALARFSANPRYNSTTHTTCVATRLNAGHANNALPQLAQANINCRILPGHSIEEVRENLLDIFADKEVRVQYIDSATNEPRDTAPTEKGLPPVAIPAQITNTLLKTATTFWAGAPLVPEMETGASDSKYTIARGIPTFGFSGLAIDRDDVRAHGKDERVRITDYYDGVEFWYRWLKALTSEN